MRLINGLFYPYRLFRRTTLVVKIVSLLLLLGLFFGLYTVYKKSTAPQVTRQTQTVQLSTIIKSISGSGTITSSNTTSITTKVSGVVSQVYVTNGQTITKGQQIAKVTLDDYALERQTATWVAYLNSLENFQQAKADQVATDINMWQARQDYLDAQDTYKNTTGSTEGDQQIINKTFEHTKLLFSVAESKYLHSNADIANANSKVAAALRDYQENSSIIIAPADGVISDLVLAPGLTISANSSTSNTTGSTIVASQTIGKISNTAGQLTAKVSLSEVDIISVKANQKVMLTLDAFPDQTFTGKVLAVDTSGSSSSGVTTYSVTILLDPIALDIYPNMAVSAKIITAAKPDVLSVPSVAITTTNGVSTVQVMKDNSPQSVTVELGISNDTDTEIISGLSAGDIVVTATIVPSSNSQTTSTTSPFGIGGSTRTTRSSGAVMLGGPGF